MFSSRETSYCLGGLIARLLCLKISAEVSRSVVVRHGGGPMRMAGLGLGQWDGSTAIAGLTPVIVYRPFGGHEFCP